MKDQIYYLIPGQEQSNFSDETRPLQVNCVGYCKRPHPYTHTHPTGRNDYFLQYITEGELIIQSDGKDQKHPKGAFIIHPPKKPYSYKSPDSRAEFFHVRFTGFHVGRLLANLGIVPGKVYRTTTLNESSANIATLFVKLFDEFTNRHHGFIDVCASLLMSILVTLSRELDKTRAGEPRTLASIAYLHQHFREDTPIGDLAAMDHLGVSRYRELFHEQMGMSPIEYRIALRIQHAGDLLSQTDLSLAEIAAVSGFSDVFYFGRMFKAKTGVSPKKYRDSEKNKRFQE